GGLDRGVGEARVKVGELGPELGALAERDQPLGHFAIRGGRAASTPVEATRQVLVFRGLGEAARALPRRRGRFEVAEARLVELAELVEPPDLRVWVLRH